MKALVVQIIGAAASLVLCLVAALMVSTWVPMKHGPLELEKPYSEYSNDELREIARTQYSEVANAKSLIELGKGRATVVIVMIWMLTIYWCYPRRRGEYLVWLFALLSGWGVGLYSESQLAILTILCASTVMVRQKLTLPKR